MKTIPTYPNGVLTTQHAVAPRAVASILFLLSVPLLAGCPPESKAATNADVSTSGIDHSTGDSLESAIGAATHGRDRDRRGHRDRDHDRDYEQPLPGDDVVAVCHVPRNNPSAAHTIYVSRHALSAHLAHGDTIGSCNDPEEGQGEEGQGEEGQGEEGHGEEGQGEEGQGEEGQGEEGQGEEGQGEEGQGEEGQGEEGQGEEGQGEEGQGEDLTTSFAAVFTNGNRPSSFSAGAELPVSIAQLDGTVTQESEFLVVGTEQSGGTGGDPANIIVARYDSAGVLVDQFSYGGFNVMDSAAAVALAHDGGWAIAGATGSVANLDGFVLRTDAGGGVQYQLLFGGAGFDRSDDIIATADGGFVFLGTTDLAGGGGNIYLARLNDRGQLLWDRSFGQGTEQGSAVLQLADGSFAVVGSTRASGTNFDVYLLRVDPSGNAISEESFGLANADELGSGLCETNDNGLVITGIQTLHGESQSDVYATRLDAAGSVAWEFVYGGPLAESANGVAATQSGNFAMAGRAPQDASGVADMYLLVVNANGAVVFENLFGGPNEDVAFGIRQTADGGYLLAGYTRSFATGALFNAYVVKTNASGHLLPAP